MKKILITTALTSMLSSIAFADAPVSSGPSISLGGSAVFESSFYGDNSTAKDSPHLNTGGDARSKTDVMFDSAAKAAIKIEGQADQGFKYGAIVGVKTNSKRDGSFGNSHLDNSYIYIESSFGRVELGANDSASKAMRVDASGIARASGGIDGNSPRYFKEAYRSILDPLFVGAFKDIPSASGKVEDVTAQFTKDPDFARKFLDMLSLIDFRDPQAEELKLFTDSLLVSLTSLSILDNKFADESNVKITYYTPSFSGFQLGVSYAPNNSRTGDQLNATAKSLLAFDNIMTGGISYKNQFDKVGVSGSVTAGIASLDKASALKLNKSLELKDGERARFSEMTAGLGLDFSGFSVSGSFGSSLKKDLINRNVYTAGVAYVQGPFGVSATYMKATTKTPEVKGSTEKDKSNMALGNFVVGADYQLAPGVLPYVEASFSEFTAKDLDGKAVELKNNKKQVYTIGTRLSF